MWCRSAYQPLDLGWPQNPSIEGLPHSLLREVVGRERREGIVRRVAAFTPTDGAELDLAWERQGVVYVAEVNSTTDLNEERQLRLGLRQVLRYRGLLRTRWHGEVRAVLVPERKPRDESWRRLCDDLGVILTSPPEFNRLDL
jgi:hypothetical protein